ncbi:MAG: tape measure protein [Clostridium fessum]
MPKVHLRTRELIAFVESINKQFAIGGTEAGAAAGAMTQLTQAMGAGALRGDELNSVQKQPPVLPETSRSTWAGPKAQLNPMRKRGAVSAEIVKNAQLAAMEEIDKKFNSMPLIMVAVVDPGHECNTESISPVPYGTKLDC